MRKINIINDVANKTGVPKQKAEQVVDALFNAMKDVLAKGKRIELRGLGVFVVKSRKRGIRHNPRTGKEVPIPSGKTIHFRVGKALVDAANQSKRVKPLAVNEAKQKEENIEETKFHKLILEFKSKFEAINEKMNFEQREIEILRNLSVERQKRINFLLQKTEELFKR